MKTFVLFFSLLTAYFFQNEPKSQQTNVNAYSECPLAEAKPQFSAAINGLAGNSGENRFKKAIAHAGNYYIIGQNGVRAALHKMDATGAIVWSREVEDTSSWNDLIINSDGNILLVGSLDISSGLPKDVLVGVFNTNGLQINLNSYDYFINESYNSIIANPLNVTSDFRYLVVGSANRTNNRNDDDVIVTTMNPNGGTTAVGWRKRYGQLNVDDEFHAKITLFNGVAGQLALLGKLNNQGVYVVIDASGNVSTTLGRAFGLNSAVNDLLRTPNNEILVASSINAPSPQSQIIKVTTTTANRFISRNASLTEVYQIVHRGGNQYYALATRTSGPVLRPCIIEFNDIGNDLSYNTAWEYNNGESYMERGHLQQSGLTDYIYTDSRTNSAQGFGMVDGFIALHANGLDSCGLKRFNPGFNRQTYTEVIVTPSVTNESTKEPFAKTSTTVNYLTKPLCNFKCTIEITLTKNACGNVQFNCLTNLGGSINYCWDFGTTPPCASTVQNPSYTYNTNGNYTVCVTVNNGQNNCSSCQTFSISNADKIAPTINCPPNITTDCSASTNPTNTGTATATDNLDPSPVINYSDFIIQMTSCYKEILRDWSATDFCGNVIHCQQTIVQSDTKAPEISCPEGIDLNCNSDINPNSTGWPTFSDNCQTSIVTSYLDEETGGPCPRIIKRKFTVTDLCQNSSTCIQEIRLWDFVPPVISNCSRKFTYQGTTEIGDSCAAYVHIQPPVAVDDCDGMVNLINNYNGMGTIDNYFPDGTNIIQWTATDLCGNTATCVDTICVLACDACPDTCLTDVILISTGYDPIDEILLPPGSTTSQWTLVESPLWGGSGSAPSYVINSIADWHDITGSHWISAHPFADWTQNNPDPLIPYTFQNCFCVCQDSTLVGIKITEALADDVMEVCLVDENGTLIENLLSIGSTGSSDHTPFDGSVTHSSSHSFILNEGKYCIRAKIRNLHGVAMGFNILGKVFGVGLLGSACCEQKNFVTGYKFIDKKCDGIRNAGIDMPGINWPILLKDDNGDVVATTHTLGDGFYAFMNVPIGHYTVCEHNIYGYIQSYPPSGSYEIDVLNAHTVISDLNFGNCQLDTCCYDEEAFIDVATTPVDVIRDSCMICISHPCIGWCQRLTVFWGDGTSSGYFEGIGSVDASHTYTQSGEYEICLRFEELNDNGDLCFTKDSCFTVCVQCGICESEEMTLNCFGLHGDSEIPTVNGTLGNHSDFYIEADNLGNYYTTGHYSNVPGGSNDCFVSKFKNNCELCWNISIGGNDGSDQGLIIKHFTGGFYVAGISNSTVISFPNGGGAPTNITNSSNESHVFLAKYSDPGICGDGMRPILDWVLTYGNNEYRTLVSDMDLDNNNNPILIGIITGELTFDKNVIIPPATSPAIYSTLPTASGGNQDMYMVKFYEYNGQQLWAKTLLPSSTNKGGAYPLGISVDLSNKTFYIAGHYSKTVDFDNDGVSDLSGGPNSSNSAPFVAKFDDVSGEPGLFWAFPIRIISPVDDTWHHGVATDVEAYIDGFALSIEKFQGLSYMYDFNPRGISVIEHNNHEISYIIRYDTGGIHQCHYTFLENDFVNEMSVDQDKNIYFIGGRNIDKNVSSGNLGELGFNFYNTFFGVINNNCEAKTFNLDGNKEDAGWSIAPLGGKEFAIIGRSTSVNLDADPNPMVDAIYSATEGDPSIPDIFIGKYSCECIMAPDTMDCCDKIYVIAEKVDHPELTCIDSACCYTVDFYNDAGFSIKNATVNILTPGWEFGTLSVPSDLTVDSDPVSLIIQNSSGNLPGGFTDGFVNFCLSGQIGSPNQQEIEFIWYEKTKSGGCIAVCRDTIITDCVAPTCASNCIQLVNMEIVCDSTDANKYCMYFNVENLSPDVATGLIIDVSGSGFGLHPCGINGFYDPLEIIFGGSGLAPGATSGTLCVKLLSTTPVLIPQQVCFSFGLLFGDTTVCFQDSLYCYEILPCCNPCEDIQIIAREIEVDSASCCYAIDLNIACAIDYFGKIEIEALTPGVVFGSHVKDPSWIYCTPPSPDLICLDYPTGYLPSGLTQNVLKFCIDTTSPNGELGCWKQVACGSQHSVGIKQDGSLWAWGYNLYGQLGHGTAYYSNNNPLQIGNSNDWMSVYAGGHHTLAIKQDGSLWAWGYNLGGQLGDGTTINKYIPTQIGNSNDWMSVSVGNDHTIGIKQDGSLWAWGYNSTGQLGDGTNISKYIPVQIGNSFDWMSVSAGNDHTIGIKQDGSLWAWGYNSTGQLGDGTNISKYIPVQIGNSFDWMSVSARNNHTIGIKQDGSLWAWGYNFYGQLGDGTTINKYIPTQIGNSNDWMSVSGGYCHTIGIKQDGSLWAWGCNLGGQLGDGTNINKYIPTQIGNSNDWMSVSGGAYYHTNSIKQDGSLWAWGDNNTGQLGDGTNINKYIPTYILCPESATLQNRTRVEEIKLPLLSSMFKIRYYESDDVSIACDTMLTLDCPPDTINSCMIITDAFAECLPDLNGYKLSFLVDNISSPVFNAANLIINSTDANILSITPNPVNFFPELSPSDPPRMVMVEIETTSFPDPDGLITLSFQLTDAAGNIFCNQVVEVPFLLPSCDTSCAICPEHTIQGPNLIKNPDFSDGNMYFSSQLNFEPSALMFSGTYSVRNSTNLINTNWACIDHTLGSPLESFFVASGPSSLDPIWSQKVSLQAGTTYVFCFWANNLVTKKLQPFGPPILTAKLSTGQIVIPATVINQAPDKWVLLTGTFTASTTGTFDIQIWDSQTFEWDDIAIDDISLVACASTCKCDKLSSIEIYNSEFSKNITCQGGKNNPPVSYLIPCPKNETSFNIEGNLVCSDSCDGVLQWEIKNDAGIIILFGTEFVNPATPLWTLNLLYSQFNQGESYFMSLNGICGSDTCICDFQFHIQECDSCCPKPEVFETLVQNAIHVSVDQNYCKAIVTFDNLPCDVRIQSINWRDGTISTGPFYPGSMVMHTYAPTNLSYEIIISILEYPAGGGKACNFTKLKIPVSLNCKKCCAPGFQSYIAWFQLVVQGFQTTIDGCNVTVAAPQFGSCHFFETSPNWGDPPAPVTGPFPASTVWTHTYSGPGTYTICVTVSEYPFGDPTLEPCRSRQICKNVVIEDCNGPCVCDGFSNLSFYYDKENKLMTRCDDTLTLECPPDDCVWIFSGNLLCKNDCPESLVNWQLVDSYTSLPVASGTSVAFPGFGIYIPPAIVTAGGEYDLIMNGQCDPNVQCPCRIHLIFPGCNEICPCDPDDLVNDVETGISTYTILNGCTACFRPLALQECDMVNWYLLPNLNQIATSLGNQLVCYDFRLPGIYRIKMEVTRKNEDGSICAVYEKLFTLNINCFTFPLDDQETVVCSQNESTLADLSEWRFISDTFDHPHNRGHNSVILLKGNFNQSEVIRSPFPVCLNQENVKLRLKLQLDENTPLRPGTRLVIGQLPDPYDQAVLWKKHKVLTSISLEDLPQGTIHIESPVSRENPIPEDCIDNKHSLVYITIHLVNDLSNELINASSELEILDICLDAPQTLSAIHTSDYPEVRVIPNPTNNAFNLEVNSVKYQNSQIEIYDQFGKKVEILRLDKQTSKLQFGLDYLPGLYLLKLNGPHDSRVMKLIKTGH